MTAPPTTSRLRRAWRQLRGLVLTALALLIIVTALLVGVGRALIPHADHLRPWLEARASEQLGQAVQLERVEVEWPRLTPSLSLIGVRLDDGAGNQLSIDRARLEIHLPNLLDRQANLVRLVLLGLELVLGPDADGNWGLQLGGAAASGSGADWTQALPAGDLLIRDALVRVRPLQWPEILLQIDEGSVHSQGGQTRFRGDLSRPGGDEQLELRLLIEHADPQQPSARGWLNVEGLTPEALLGGEQPAGRRWLSEASSLDLQLWLDWQMATNQLALDLDLAAQAEPRADRLRMLARLEASRSGLGFEISELSHGGAAIGSGLAAGRHMAEAHETWAVVIEQLDLARLHRALEPWLQEQRLWPLALSGQIEGLVLGLDRALSLHAAEGRISDLEIQMAEPLPSIAGLDLDLGLDGDRLVLAPGGQPIARWQRHIRGDMVLDAIAGQLLLAPSSIELRGFHVDSAVARATADGWVYLQQPRPFLDFLIDVQRIGPIDPRPYLSYRTIPPAAMNWLDQALLWVDNASGLVNLHLTAGTRARDLRPGSYQAYVDIRGLQLDYFPGWPRAESIDGSVSFIGGSLSGTVQRARFSQIELAVPAVEIADLTAPLMTLELVADDVPAEELQTVLAGIPVEGFQTVLGALRWSGPLDASTRLRLPFRRMSDWAIDGELSFAEAAVGLRQPDLALDALSGSLQFDRSGLRPAVLQARLDQQVFDLAVAAGFEAPVSLALEANFNPAGLAAVDQALGPLAAGLQGASTWSFRLDGLPAGSGGGLDLQLDSDLYGLAIDWPAPLDKAAAARWPAQARLALRPERQQLELEIAERVSGHWQQADQGWSLGLGLGAALRPDLPPSGARIRGQLEQLALRDWLAQLGDLGLAAPESGFEFFDLELEADVLQLPGVLATGAAVRLARGAEGWSAHIDSAQMAGSVNIPMPLALGRAVVADLDRLHLERAPASEAAAEPERLDPREGVSEFSPRGLPPLSLAVEDLRWGELALGRARIEAHPIEPGLEVELFDISGTDLRLQGRGRWIDAEGGPQSEFVGRLTSPSLGALVRAAGYEAGLDAARAQVDLDVSWPGAPQNFALRRLLGSLDLQLSDGEIPEARPGAGRLLGLASFNAIPRRLLLDFRDVFAAGLRFDEVSGRFELGGGFASTEGLVLRSPAAVITISGQTDILARRYDQQIRVEPGLGATLPVIGGLAGGPIGAAAGLVLGQLLERPLRGLAEARYQVTGPWDAPEIELVAARLPEESAATDATSTPPPR